MSDIQAIRERQKRREESRLKPGGMLMREGHQAHIDCATLLSALTAANARAEAAEARVGELEALVYSPGIMRCAKCNFQLYRRILNAHSGNIGAGASETEPCPNGCGPLWPVTWKQHHHDYAEGAEQLIDELQTELDAARTLKGAPDER